MPNVRPIFNDDRASRQNLWDTPANTLQAIVNDLRVGRRKTSQILAIYPDTLTGKLTLIQCGYTKREIQTALKGILKSLEKDDGSKRGSHKG